MKKWKLNVFPCHGRGNLFGGKPPRAILFKIVGYIGAWILSGEGQVTNVAVHPSFRRRGIGEKLFAEFIACGIKRGMTAVTLEVRPSNKAAIALYEKFGLKSVGRRKGYYIDNGEDAEIMWNTKITETFGGIGRKNFEQ